MSADPIEPEAPKVLTVEQLAAAAGVVWLDSGVTRPPTENDLSSVAANLCAHPDSLALVRACVLIADAVSWLLHCRKLAAAAQARSSW